MPRFLMAGLLTILLAGQAMAAELTGTLKRVSDTGTFTIGYVPDIPPMSFAGEDGKPTGYSLDLCRRIAAAVKQKLELDDLEIKYVPLTAPEDRINAVATGAVDIECGSTTITMDRRERVDFTLLTFITGGAVLSLKTKPINTIGAVAGRTIAVIAGTTTEAALRDLAYTNEFELKLRKIGAHAEGLTLLNTGEVDGYASDRTTLIGQVLRESDSEKYAITRDVFSFEPYAFMVERGDTEFRLVADRALAKLYGTARIKRIYYDWFGSAGIQATPILEAMYEFQALK